MYRIGLPLVIDEHPHLRQLSAELAAALRVDATYVSCKIFAAPRGATAPQHFDRASSVAFQMVGRKKWLLRKNEIVSDPLTGWAMGDSVSADLRLGASEPFPAADFVDCDTAIMSPGDAFFFPRGHWHATEALEDSVSLNVHIVLPTWLDVLQPVLRRLLGQDVLFRTTAPLKMTPDDARSRLAQLKRCVAALTVADIAPDADSALAPPCETTIFRRRATATLSVESPDPTTCVVHSSRGRDVRRATVEIDPNFLGASRQICSEPMTGAEFAVAAGSELDTATDVLLTLEGAGLLYRDDPSGSPISSGSA
jgi:hypothetical protein